MATRERGGWSASFRLSVRQSARTFRFPLPFSAPGRKRGRTWGASVRVYSVRVLRRKRYRGRFCSCLGAILSAIPDACINLPTSAGISAGFWAGAGAGRTTGAGAGAGAASLGAGAGAVCSCSSSSASSSIASNRVTCASTASSRARSAASVGAFALGLTGCTLWPGKVPACPCITNLLHVLQ